MAVQTITKTIGTTSRQYSTLQSWEDAKPANLTTCEKSAAGTFMTASFVFNETLTFSPSGATGVFLATDSTGPGNGTYILYAVSTGNPGIADTVTGGTSGATCLLSSGTPTDTGIIWRGEGYKDSTFTARVTLGGSTTSATCYTELTAAAGQSFVDTAANALRFNTANGVAISFTGGYATALSANENNCRVNRWQVKSANNTELAFNAGGGANCIIDQCIAEGQSAGGSFSPAVMNITDNVTVKNCLVVRTAGTNPGVALSRATLSDCTIVNVNATTTGKSLDVYYSGTSSVVRNVAGFNFASAPTTSATSENNATDHASPPTGWTGSVAYSTATFANITAGSEDFKTVTGSALVGAGSASGTTPDIFGTSRPQGAAWDIGCFELVAAAAAAARSIFLKSRQALNRSRRW